VSAEERRQRWQRDGFYVLPGFAPEATCRAMRERAIEIARKAGGAGRVGHALVVPEARPDPRARSPEERVSKVFLLHREAPFADFCREERLLDLVAEILGPDLDCFGSQFIFKYPGALGQPWHQDAYYFPFDRGPQVGIWLAVTEAVPENGPLHVLPGSHREPVHDVVPDRRGYADVGYVEIVDFDTSGARPVLMSPGDLLVFHSHLMHRSTDNVSRQMRAAMVFHFAQGGTEDRFAERFGHPSPVHDWLPLRRRKDLREPTSTP
jgi:ectoine hydroxylase-related dioxygenase (phytanoyl-CoA dioxygenase family)